MRKWTLPSRLTLILSKFHSEVKQKDQALILTELRCGSESSSPLCGIRKEGNESCPSTRTRLGIRATLERQLCRYVNTWARGPGTKVTRTEQWV